MVELDRRTLFAGAALGALAAPSLMTRAAQAQDATKTAGAPTAGDKALITDVHQFKVGDLEVAVIRDGMVKAGKPNETFGTNQPATAVSELLAKNFLPTEAFVNGFSPVLVKSGSDLVLFDTGFGKAGRPNGTGRLVQGMQQIGYSPDDVTVVVLTHMHGDHIGGLMEDGKPTFGKARYVTGQTEYDFWVNPARQGTTAENGQKGVLANVKPLAEKITFLGDKGGDVVSGIRSEPAFGHSPGHMIYRLESGGKQLVLTGDTANHYVLSLQRPDWEVRFDMDKARAAATRKAVFDMLATDKVAFLGYHMPFPSVGFVEKLDTGYRFVPKSYQFDI